MGMIDMKSNGNIVHFEEFIYKTLKGKIRTVRAKSKRISSNLIFLIIDKIQLKKYQTFLNKHNAPWKIISNINEILTYFKETKYEKIKIENNEIGILFCQQHIWGDSLSSKNYSALIFDRKDKLEQPRYEVVVKTNKENMLLLDNIKRSETYNTIVIDSQNEDIVSSIYKHVMNKEIKFKRIKVSNINFDIEGLSSFEITDLFSENISYEVKKILTKSSIPFCLFIDENGRISFTPFLFEDQKKNYVQGFRKDLNSTFNSAMEANFARILNYLGISWKYEETGFGNKDYVYIPDFFLENNIIIETKGFWDQRSRTNVYSFKKYEKGYRLLILDYDMFYTLNKIYEEKLPNWERHKVNVKAEKLPVVGINQGERKKYVSKLEKQEEVYLIREPNNDFDKNAIKVVNNKNEQLGYISKEMACIYSDKIDIGMKYKGVVHEKNENVVYIKVKRTNLDDNIVYDFLREK